MRRLTVPLPRDIAVTSVSNNVTTALQVGRTAQVMGELSNCLQATKHLEWVLIFACAWEGKDLGRLN